MSVRPFAERVVAKLSHVSDGYRKKATEAVDSDLAARLNAVAEAFDSIKSVLLDEAAGWDQSRGAGSPAALGKLSERLCAKMLGSVIAGLVQLSDVDSVRSAIRQWHENEEIWEQLRSVESTEVEGH